MLYIKNIRTSQQVYIPRQTINTASTQNCGCIDLEDYYTREEVDALIEEAGFVTKEYVDTQDTAERERAEAIENQLKQRIGALFDYHSNTLYLNNQEQND